MGKGYNNYMCKKPFHPGSKANIKRAWMAEQKTENEKRKQDELKVQYEKEQDLYNNRALISSESKDKLELNFMYEAPPGAKRERQKEDDEPEYKFEWQRKYNAPREDYAKGNEDIKDQPFGIPVRNVRCIKCHKWGHINTDKECPLFHQASTSSMPTTSMDPIELMRQMKEDGFGLKEHVLGHQLNPNAANQQFIQSDESDPEMDFLKSLSTAEKKKLLRKLKKLSKKQEKAANCKKKKSKKNKKAKPRYSSSSDSEEEVKIKKKKKKSKKSSSSESESSSSSDESVKKRKKKNKHAESKDNLSKAEKIKSKKSKEATCIKSSDSSSEDIQEHSSSETNMKRDSKKDERHLQSKNSSKQDLPRTKPEIKEMEQCSVKQKYESKEITHSRTTSDEKKPNYSKEIKKEKFSHSSDGSKSIERKMSHFVDSSEHRGKKSGHSARTLEKERQQFSEEAKCRESKQEKVLNPERSESDCDDEGDHYKEKSVKFREIKQEIVSPKKRKFEKTDSYCDEEGDSYKEKSAKFRDFKQEIVSPKKRKPEKSQSDCDDEDDRKREKSAKFREIKQEIVSPKKRKLEKSESDDCDDANDCKKEKKSTHPDGFSHFCPQAFIRDNYLLPDQEYKGAIHDRFRHLNRDKRSPSVKQKYNK